MIGCDVYTTDSEGYHTLFSVPTFRTRSLRDGFVARQRARGLHVVPWDHEAKDPRGSTRCTHCTHTIEEHGGIDTCAECVAMRAERMIGEADICHDFDH
jgi:hypothetical protein